MNVQELGDAMLAKIAERDASEPDTPAWVAAQVELSALNDRYRSASVMQVMNATKVDDA